MEETRLGQGTRREAGPLACGLWLVACRPAASSLFACRHAACGPRLDRSESRAVVPDESHRGFPTCHALHATSSHRRERYLCVVPSKRGKRRFASSRLRPRDPLTPAEVSLPLLPSGPHGVHRHAPQRAQPSTSLARGQTLPPLPSGNPSVPLERVVDVGDR